MNEEQSTPKKTDSPENSADTPCWPLGFKPKNHYAKKAEQAHGDHDYPYDDGDKAFRAFRTWLIIRFHQAKFIEFCQIVLSVALLVVGVVAAYVYAGQLQEMRNTNTLTQAALDASKKAVQTQVDSFQMDERPWVTESAVQLILNQSGGSNVLVYTGVGNIGKTPAYDVTISNFGFTLSYKPLDIDKFLQTPEGRKYATPSVPAIMVVGYKSFLKTSKDVPPYQADDVKAGKLLVYTFGDISYTDAFGNSHFTRYCGLYDPKIEGMDQFTVCKTHNFVDRNK